MDSSGFPEVPLELLMKIPGKSNYDPSFLPFNRHRRRQITQAKTLVINLFAGSDLSVWKQQEGNGVVIINLDVLSGGDLLKNPHLAGWIQEMAEEGKVDVWLAGPPCRTVSLCRHREGPGPPPVRSRFGCERFGLAGLEERLRQQVEDDSVMWLRTLWWYYLSSQADQGKPSAKRSEYLLEQPLDPHEWLPQGGTKLHHLA